MNKFKPFVLGSLAGAGLMFGLLNYHIVHSHDGLQLVPRTPQPSLGLAFADIRQYDAQQWTDRPELARALVAHGSSDLISQSVVENVTRSINEEGGTVDRLRSLLNDSGDANTSEFDRSLFDLFERDTGGARPSDGGLAIPFPAESRAPSWKDELAERTPDRVLDGFGNPVSDPFLEPWTPSESTTRSRSSADRDDRDLSWPSQRMSWPSQPSAGDPFAEEDFYDQRATDSAREQRRRDMESLEESLFGDDDGMDSVDASSGSLDSVRRSLNSRAKRVLERARQGLRDEFADATDGRRSTTDGYVREQLDRIVPDARKPTSGSPPNLSSGRASEDDAGWWDDTLDPFLNNAL